jgi:hypothetical protein
MGMKMEGLEHVLKVLVHNGGPLEAASADEI